MSLPVLSDIFFVPFKSILIPMCSAFYNNSDSAGAELQKHATPSNSQCEYKMWNFFTVAQLR